jgi:hypothetical protein
MSKIPQRGCEPSQLDTGFFTVCSSQQGVISGCSTENCAGVDADYHVKQLVRM